MPHKENNGVNEIKKYIVELDIRINTILYIFNYSYIAIAFFYFIGDLTFIEEGVKNRL